MNSDPEVECPGAKVDEDIFALLPSLSCFLDCMCSVWSAFKSCRQCYEYFVLAFRMCCLSSTSACSLGCAGIGFPGQIRWNENLSTVCQALSNSSQRAFNVIVHTYVYNELNR